MKNNRPVLSCTKNKRKTTKSYANIKINSTLTNKDLKKYCAMLINQWKAGGRGVVIKTRKHHSRFQTLTIHRALSGTQLHELRWHVKIKAPYGGTFHIDLSFVPNTLQCTREAGYLG